MEAHSAQAACGRERLLPLPTQPAWTKLGPVSREHVDACAVEETQLTACNSCRSVAEIVGAHLQTRKAGTLACLQLAKSAPAANCHGCITDACWQASASEAMSGCLTVPSMPA